MVWDILVSDMITSEKFTIVEGNVLRLWFKKQFSFDWKQMCFYVWAELVISLSCHE